MNTTTLLNMLLASAASGDAGGMLVLWGVILFVIAVLLFGLEMFIPTGGVLGLLGAIAVIASVVAFFRHDAVWGAMALGTYLVLTPFGIYFGFKFWSSSPITRSLILDGDDPALMAEPEEAMASSEQQRVRRLAELDAVVGMEGRTVTPLRPVGIVLLDGRRIDALAEFGTIDANVAIEVVQVIDNQVKVRPASGRPRRDRAAGNAPP